MFILFALAKHSCYWLCYLIHPTGLIITGHLSVTLGASFSALREFNGDLNFHLVSSIFFQSHFSRRHWIMDFHQEPFKLSSQPIIYFRNKISFPGSLVLFWSKEQIFKWCVLDILSLNFNTIQPVFRMIFLPLSFLVPDELPLYLLLKSLINLCLLH